MSNYFDDTDSSSQPGGRSHLHLVVDNVARIVLAEPCISITPVCDPMEDAVEIYERQAKWLSRRAAARSVGKQSRGQVLVTLPGGW